MPLVDASCFPNLFNKVPCFSLLRVIFENSVSILHELAKVLTLSYLINGMLHYQDFVTALKSLFTVISSALVYKHRKCIKKSASFNFSIKLVENCFTR